MAEKTIIFDTNFLIYCLKFKINLSIEIERIANFKYKLAVLDSTIKELRILQERQKTRIIAKTAEKLAKNFKIISSKKPADIALIELSKKPNIIIATQDKDLKKSLNSEIIIIRQKNYLELKPKHLLNKS